jgi:hypothetical protein
MDTRGRGSGDGGDRFLPEACARLIHDLEPLDWSSCTSCATLTMPRDQ